MCRTVAHLIHGSDVARAETGACAAPQAIPVLQGTGKAVSIRAWPQDAFEVKSACWCREGEQASVTTEPCGMRTGSYTPLAQVVARFFYCRG